MNVKVFKDHSVKINNGDLKDKIFQVKYKIGNKYMVHLNGGLKSVDVEDAILLEPTFN
jgi:hypothetical protein